MSEQDEIARLRALWCEEKSKSMTFHAEIERLRAEVARVTAERDEARRSACTFKARYMDSRIGFSPMTDDESKTEAKKIAARLGWGCFKEVQP